ncbi:MAG: carboxypeptidase M32 [Bacteroidota bacterium]|nr:carboxypeptidase M32 [Ferruginibacter sp.]
MSSAGLYDEYKTKMQKIADVKYASAVLQWDQETYLPPKGNEFRGRQIATLTETAHELFISEKLGALLQELNAREDLGIQEKKNVQLSLEDYERNKKLSGAFVREMSEAVTRSYHAWAKARAENNFEIFHAPLHTVIELKKQEAELLGYKVHRYNALMNDYDKGLTVAITDEIFEDLKPQLISLLNEVRQKPQVDNKFLSQSFDTNKQWKFGMEILKRIGFDFEAGRQDISLHPFTINFNSRDVRVTTRIDEHDLGNMTWSCIHEGGHALYEQGLPEEQYGLPLGEYCSLSIHESQSRLWENSVGRAKPFWEHNFQLLKTFFPGQLDKLSIEEFYNGINRVEPSLIRTEADELTYHLHVMIRYELEKRLIEGTLGSKDIPAYWNELYKQYLGVIVPDDKRGCLQDIHWSHGSFGYFATYSLGSIYAAQFYAAIQRQNPSLEEEIARGKNDAILDWLKTNIYPHGRFYTSGELCYNVTGEKLNSKYFIDYATSKFTNIYS